MRSKLVNLLEALVLAPWKPKPVLPMKPGRAFAVDLGGNIQTKLIGDFADRFSSKKANPFFPKKANPFSYEKLGNFEKKQVADRLRSEGVSEEGAIRVTNLELPESPSDRRVLFDLLVVVGLFTTAMAARYFFDCDSSDPPTS